ncbi:MAG: hybrid sensor histidine kinase/response regulator [Gammaproteobacteria bacterium]
MRAPLRTSLELLSQGDQGLKWIQQTRPIMERQVLHLVRLVDDLLDLSRINRGTIKLKRSGMDLRDAIDGAIEQVKPELQAAGHQLTVDRAECALPIEGDFQRLVQVMANLLSNATKYTEPPGQITLRCRVEGDQAVVCVRDSGYGIPPERLGSHFDMFSQVREHQRRTGGGGLGIGLALPRYLVERHGGTIEARSEGLGLGSEFIVRLPLAAAAPSVEQGEVGDANASAREPYRGGVLVVDDNINAAQSLRMLLELKGHRTQVAVATCKHPSKNPQTSVFSARIS